MAILPCRERSPKDKAMVKGTGGVICNFILTAFRKRRFLSPAKLNEVIGEHLYEFNHKPFPKKEASRALAFETARMFNWRAIFNLRTALWLLTGDCHSRDPKNTLREEDLVVELQTLRGCRALNRLPVQGKIPPSVYLISKLE